jgi:phosphoglycolate phosphatase-like HAD superfamily hydrolase
MSNFFEAVFFDMDGLMVDSEPEWFLSEVEVTKPFGYTWLEVDQIACLGGPLSMVLVPSLNYVPRENSTLV